MATTPDHSDVVTIDLLTDLIARVEYLTQRVEALSRQPHPRRARALSDGERSVSTLLLELHGVHAQLGAAIAALERRELRKLL